MRPLPFPKTPRHCDPTRDNGGRSFDGIEIEKVENNRMDI
jgi:hypothetical protein